MQDAMRLSFLTWDNPTNIPIPDEVKEITTKLDWGKQEWQAYGLPIPFAHYSVLDGKILYLDELPNGETKTQKMEEFTGRVMMSSFFVNEDEEGFNYFLTFIVTFFKGEVMEVNKTAVSKHPTKEYKEAYEDFVKGMKRAMMRSQTWWFKYLYMPYAIVVRFIAMTVIKLLEFLKFIIFLITKFLTPL